MTVVVRVCLRHRVNVMLGVVCIGYPYKNDDSKGIR